MDLARLLLALGLLAAACATPQPPAPEPRPAPARPEDLRSIYREMTAIDVSRQRGPADAARPHCNDGPPPRPEDAAERYLELYKFPLGERMWSCFRELAEKVPGSAWGHLGMARLDLAWGTLDRAEAEIARALQVAPQNWIALLHRAQLEELRHAGREARADYARVLEADPENAEAHIGLARLLREAGDFEGALREGHAALAAAPELYPALALVATLSVDLGDREQAAVYLRKAAASSPREYEALALLARLQARSGDARGAIERWRAALALREERAGLRSLAEVARSTGDAEAELYAVTRLTRLEPAQADGWRRLAALVLAKGDVDGAVGALRKAVELEPGHAPSRLYLGRVLESRGEAAEALDHYRAAGERAQKERLALERKLHVERVARSDAGGVQRAVGALVDRTYRARLGEKPSLSGRLELLAVVDADGSASQVDVVEDTLHDEWVRGCAYWNLRDARYPTGQPARYTFRFTLRK